MRRLPLLELLMAGVVVVAAIVVLDAQSDARRILATEIACFELMGRFDRSGPVPGELEPVEGTVARRHGGYLFVAYLPGPDGPRATDVTEAIAAEGPYLVLAWPETYAESARRAWMLRAPGFILETENDRRTVSGLPVPPCPWSDVTLPSDDPMDPEEGVPDDWIFGKRGKQRPRLEALGLRWTERFERHVREENG